MSTIFIQPMDRTEQLMPLAQAAVNGEIVRLDLALSLARERLLPFERKYSVTSEHFIDHMVAEDLEGGDDEYVQWAGEYRLMQRLEEKLLRLREVEYDDAAVLRQRDSPATDANAGAQACWRSHRCQPGADPGRSIDRDRDDTRLGVTP
jgi:hypothetical protein